MPVINKLTTHSLSNCENLLTVTHSSL